MNPTDETLVNELAELLKKFPEEAREIGPDTDIVADLGLDSPQVMDLILEIEDQYDISVPLNILPDVQTVSDLAIQVGKLIRNEG